jgi:hypothetical protein
MGDSRFRRTQRENENVRSLCDLCKHNCYGAAGLDCVVEECVWFDRSFPAIEGVQLSLLSLPTEQDKTN